MTGCVSGKIQYGTEKQAEEALIATHVKFNFQKDEGPRAVYRCDDCGFYHLTSKGKINDRLESLLKKKEIDLRKEASHWETKLKRKS